jgi:flagellar hook-associated protein 2
MSTSISFNGLGSGIDFSQIINAIVTERTQPVTQLQNKVSDYSSRIDALKQLNALLATLTNAAQGLTDQTLGSGHAATSLDSTIVSASATSDAVNGQFDLNISRLASRLVQASQSFSSPNAPILADPNTPATFELRKGGASSGAQITISSANNSLAGLRDAINAANAGVTASIVDVAGDGTQNQLVLSSTDTGAAGRVELVETSSTGTGANLNLRSLNPPGATTDFSALDASLTINGLPITRSTNTISDAVSGVTFTLKKAGATSVNVTSSTDISDKLQTFINAYNAVQDFIAAQYKPDNQGRPTGVLAGDPTLRAAQQQLRDALNSFSTNNGGALQSLADIGIGRDSSGHLTLDSAKLNSELASSASDVKALLAGAANGETGLGNLIYSASNALSDSITGLVQTAINGYQASVKNLNNSIADQLDAINQLRDSLTRQFAAVDAAINQLNSQGTSLTNILNSMQPKSSN